MADGQAIGDHRGARGAGLQTGDASGGVNEHVGCRQQLRHPVGELVDKHARLPGERGAQPRGQLLVAAGQADDAAHFLDRCELAHRSGDVPDAPAATGDDHHATVLGQPERTAGVGPRMQAALDFLWPYTGEMFEADAVDEELAASGLAPEPGSLRAPWREHVAHTLAEATLKAPEDLGSSATAGSLADPNAVVLFGDENVRKDPQAGGRVRIHRVRGGAPSVMGISGQSSTHARRAAGA